MAQKYLEKINKASTAEYRNRRKIRLMILIITVAAALFEVSDFGMKSYKENGAIVFAPRFTGFFGLFLMFVAAGFGAFAVYGVFSDLTNKQTADVQLSLPMSAKDRYYSKLLAVAKLHLIPIVCASVFVTIIGCVRGSAELGDTFLYLFKIHCIILAEALFVDSVCIFCMCCCGAKAEGVYTSMITACCVSVTPMLLYHFVIDHFSSVILGGDVSDRIFTTFGAMVAMCFPDEEMFSASESWIYLLINIVLSCLLIFASFFIYRKRDGRQVGRPMVYDLFMELFMFVGLFTLFTMFSYIRSWGIGLTVALIIYLVIRIVAARAKITPKNFMIWVFKFGASFAIFIVIMAAGYFTGGFGHYKLRNDKIKYDTSRAEISVTQYSYGDEYETNGRTFRQSAHIKENLDMDGEWSDPYYEDDPRNYISRAEAEERLHKINALVDKYYTLENRSASDFMDMMFRLDRYSYYDDYEREDYVSVHISVTDENELRYNSSYNKSNNFQVTFDIPVEKYEDFLKDAQEILPEVYDGNYRDYDYYY